MRGLLEDEAVAGKGLIMDAEPNSKRESAEGVGLCVETEGEEVRMPGASSLPLPFSRRLSARQPMLSSLGWIKGKSGSWGAPPGVFGALARTSLSAKAGSNAAAASALKSPGRFHVHVDDDDDACSGCCAFGGKSGSGDFGGGAGALRGLVQPRLKGSCGGKALCSFGGVGGGCDCESCISESNGEEGKAMGTLLDVPT